MKMSLELFTMIWLLSWVSSLVFLQAAWSRKYCRTLFTRKWWFLRLQTSKNVFGHSLQEYGSSPKWILWWLRKCLWAFFKRIWFLRLPESVLWCIFRRPVENISWGLQCLYGLKSIVPHWKLIKVNISILEIGSNFHAHFCDFLEIGWKIFFH